VATRRALRLVIEMLQLTPTTPITLVMHTARINTMRRRGHDLQHTASTMPCLRNVCHLHHITRRRAWDETGQPVNPTHAVATLRNAVDRHGGNLLHA
jgi:hypothetical protein